MRRQRAFLYFFGIILSIWASAHAYMGLRLIGDSSLSAPWSTAAWTALLACMLAVPGLLLSYRWGHTTLLARALRWPAHLWMSLAGMLLPLVAARDVIRLVAATAGAAWAAPGVVPPGFPPAVSNAMLVALAVALAVLGFAQAQWGGKIARVTIPLPGLPPALDGFRIVQISDLHAGGTVRGAFLDRTVAAVNALHPDLIAFTGDLADGYPSELRRLVSAVGKLRAPLGTWFVTGNHEYYFDLKGWLRELPGLGLKVLHNAHRVLRWRGASLVLAGVPDPTAEEFPGAGRPDPAGALRGAPRSAVRILLSHQPRTAEAAARAGFDLQLSGHTHGGQMLPWKYLVARFQRRLSGLHRIGRMWLYVTRGTGYWGPPNRLGVPPEITLVTLSRSRQRPPRSKGPARTGRGASVRVANHQS